MSIKRYLSYTLRWLIKNTTNNNKQKPAIINFPLTDNCNSRCNMCNVWKNNSKNEITNEELKAILTDDFFTEVEHIGISGGEPTLRKDLPQICSTIIFSLPCLKTLSITSHGYHYEKWDKYLPIIKSMCEENDIKFTLNLSMDGYGVTHDTVRGIPNAFIKLCKTIEIALAYNIKVQLQSTISNINLYDIGRTLNFARKKNIEIVYRVATKIKRLNNESFIEDIALNNEERSYFADFILSKAVMEITKSPSRRLFYKDLAKRLELKQIYRKAPCYFQSEGVLLTAHRELYQCSIVEDKILDITPAISIAERYFSQYSTHQRDAMIESLCKNCLHDQSGAWQPYALAKEIFDQSPLGKKILLLQEAVLFGNKLVKVLIKNAMVSQNKIENLHELEKVVIIGAYGGEHVGDSAILGGVALRLHEKFNTKHITVLSFRPERTIRWVNCLTLPLDIQVLDYSDSKKLSSLSNADALIYGGGPIMDLPKSLVDHLSTILIAKQYKLPFIIEGVGAGPFRSNLSILLSNKIFDYADKITVRTQDAKNWIRRKDLKIDIDRDPAFDYLRSRPKLSLMTKTERDSLDKLLINSKQKIVGLNLRPLWKKYSKNLTEQQIKETEHSFLESFSKLLIQLNEKDDITFIFFPMNPDQFGFSDLSIAYQLEEKVKERCPSIDYRVWDIEPGIDILLLLIRKLDLAITMRFHASIFCLSQSIPTFGIDYMLQGKGKVYELFKDLGKEGNVTNLLELDDSWFKKIHADL